MNIKSFWGSSSGATAILAAFLLMVLFVSTGIAIDFSGAQSERVAMQSAADAAALAAARITSGDTSEQTAVGQSLFELNYPDHASINFSVTMEGGVLKVLADKTYRTKMLQVVGIDNVPISVRAEVPALGNGSAEIVLVLDFSSSMFNNNKYIRLKDAARQMIDTISDNGANPNVRFGIVPFSGLVHVDLPVSYVRSDVTYNGCTQDRRHPANAGEAAGYSDDSRWGEIVSGYSCSRMIAGGLKVLPLNSDVAEVKNKLALMQPYGWTHIALGAAFGQQVLSPSGPFADAVDYAETSTVKVFVLLTDGMQTAPAWGPGGAHNRAHAEHNLLAICEEMKQRGVNVYTVGYDLNDSQTLNLLETCAGDGNFFDAQDVSTGLLASFNTISSQVTSAMLRISK